MPPHHPGPQAAIGVRILYGAPRPVLVVTVSGEIDRGNEAALGAGLRAPEAFTGAIVLDLRTATFVAAGVLGTLATRRDPSNRPLRVVSPEGSAVRRALDVLAISTAFDLYTDLIEAVLADVVPGE